MKTGSCNMTSGKLAPRATGGVEAGNRHSRYSVRLDDGYPASQVNVKAVENKPSTKRRLVHIYRSPEARLHCHRLCNRPFSLKPSEADMSRLKLMTLQVSNKETVAAVRYSERVTEPRLLIACFLLSRESC